MGWEDAVMEFLEGWKGKIEGAVVSGSIAVGGSTERSDIDLQIILKPGTRWRERGNRIVNGFLIEYFANPPEQIRKYFEEEWKAGRPATARMFATGKILVDRSGIAKEIVKEARKWLKRRPRFGRYEIEMLKYSAWDMADEIEDVPEEWLPYVYYQFLGELFSRYSVAVGWENPVASKIWKFLEMKDNYRIRDYPDKKFLNLFLKAIQRPDRKMLKKIVKYIHRKFGGFKIDGWRLRSKVNL